MNLGQTSTPSQLHDRNAAPTSVTNARHVSTVSAVYLNSRAVPMPVGAVPSPGMNVVMLGGPARIGGRLCLHCGGRGMTLFLIFDEMPCRPHHRMNTANKLDHVSAASSSSCFLASSRLGRPGR